MCQLSVSIEHYSVTLSQLYVCVGGGGAGEEDGSGPAWDIVGSGTC